MHQTLHNFAFFDLQYVYFKKICKRLKTFFHSFLWNAKWELCFLTFLVGIDNNITKEKHLILRIAYLYAKLKSLILHMHNIICKLFSNMYKYVHGWNKCLAVQQHLNKEMCVLFTVHLTQKLSQSVKINFLKCSQLYSAWVYC